MSDKTTTEDPIVEIIVQSGGNIGYGMEAPEGFEFIDSVGIPPPTGGTCGGTFYPEHRIIWGRRASLKEAEEKAREHYRGIAEARAKDITNKAEQDALRATKNIAAVEAFLSVVQKDYTVGNTYYYYKSPKVSAHYNDPLPTPESYIESVTYRGVMWRRGYRGETEAVCGWGDPYRVNELKANLDAGDWDTQIPLLDLHPTKEAAIGSGRERHAQWMKEVRAARDVAEKEKERKEVERRATMIEEARKLLESAEGKSDE